MQQAYRVVVGILAALILSGCAGGSAPARPEVNQGEAPVNVPTIARRQDGSGQGEANVNIPTPARPQGNGQGPVSGGQAQGVTVKVSEEQINRALGVALNAAQDTPITSLSVDLRPNVIGVSASIVVEGRMITSQIGLTPVVQNCALSLAVTETPARPDDIPPALWDSLINEVVTAVEKAVVTPQNVCIQGATVSDTELSLTVGR